MVSVVLQQPKYIQNLGGAVRACASFSVPTLIWTGQRVKIEAHDRTPRELRMKDYKTVTVVHNDRPFDLLDVMTPVCIELLPGAERLTEFVHPENAMYVFGPEDGSVSQIFRKFCHRFVYIPSNHCLNLAATINVVLYDRMMKHGNKI